MTSALTSFVGSIGGGVGGVASAASQLASFLAGPTAGSWWGSLRQASYGGVPFAVVESGTHFGTRNAVHAYPFRDEVWIEDLGKLPRRFEIVGFLVENPVAYDAFVQPVIAQRNQMLEVCESGLQTLVHPTFGTINNVACLDAQASESVDHGRVIMVRFTFMRSGAQGLPSVTTDTTTLLGTLAKDLGLSSAYDFVRGVATEVQKGAAVVQSAVSTVVGWYQYAESGLNDVKSLFNAVSTLGGNLGRFAGAGNAGYAGNSQTLQAAMASGTLVGQSAVSSAAVAALQVNCSNVSAAKAAGAALQQAAVGIAADTGSFTDAAQTFVNAFAATATGPADGIRLLMTLASSTSTAPASSAVSSTSTIGLAISSASAATGAFLRRTAITGLVQQVAVWQPATASDVDTMTTNVVSLIDAEIDIASNSQDDTTMAVLQQLRSTVVSDLQSRGTGLPDMVTMSFNEPLPALTLAHRIYADASRADQLVQLAQPVHPLFMPTSFDALSN